MGAIYMPPLHQAKQSRGAALSPHPKRALADLYRYAPAELRSNYDAGLISLLSSHNPRVRPTVPLGRFDNHPGAQEQQHTAALRAAIGSLLSHRGYRGPYR